VLGVPLAIADYSSVLAWMDDALATGRRATISAAAVNLVMSAREDRSAREAVEATTLIVPDGQPLVWALRALGHSAATRVYGPDLMAQHCARAAQAGGPPMFLYGGRNEAALAVLERRLGERHPGLPIAGSFAPPFRPLSALEEERVAHDINVSGAEVVWVGIGQPKQEIWMARMRPSLRPALLVGVGAAFDFHAGLVAQAPAWMGANGLEWAFRLAHEPRRLWRRYLRQNPRFVASFARQYLSERAHDAA
ncbi:MAG: WecB/TagA/CpsF family glycosyltransferase, partial [Acidobacteriota bacterium]|nr:WecB/TagA/CpsF family glycosyltransferase [Acidobacteriota bacterium]